MLLNLCNKINNIMAHKISNELESKIVELYNLRLKIKDISKICNVHSTTIHSVVKRNAISRERGKLTDIEKTNICTLYISGLSATKISNKYSVSTETVLSILKKNNIELRKSNLEIYFQDAIKMFKTDHSLTQICKKYNLNRDSLSYRLKNFGIDVKNFHNLPKFNEHVFDCIDTEEKAY